MNGEKKNPPEERDRDRSEIIDAPAESGEKPWAPVRITRKEDAGEDGSENRNPSRRVKDSAEDRKPAKEKKPAKDNEPAKDADYLSEPFSPPAKPKTPSRPQPKKATGTSGKPSGAALAEATKSARKPSTEGKPASAAPPRTRREKTGLGKGLDELLRPKPAGATREKKKLPVLQVYARRLCVEIGARPAGSRGEQQAADFIERVMSEGGAPAMVESFRTEKSALPFQLVTALLPVGAAVFFLASPPVAFILIVLGFLGYQLRAYHVNMFRIIQEKKDSSNVISQVEPREPPDKGAPQIVLLSHYDSPAVSSSRIPYAEKIESFWASWGGMVLGLMFLLYTVGMGLYVLKAEHGAQQWIWAISLPFVLPSLALLLLVTEVWWRGEKSMGANDNASGTAVLLALQRHYRKTPPRHAEIWFAATGGGAANSAGVSNLIRQHGSELSKAYFINIEEVGRRQLLCLRREGALFPFHANRKLLSKAKGIAFRDTQFGVSFAGRSMTRHEGLKLLTKRRRALTVTSCPKRKTARSAKPRPDDYDGLDLQALRKTYEFVKALVEDIDENADGPRISA